MNQESSKQTWKKSFRSFALKNILFKLVDRFLYIGSQNKMLYRCFGVAEGKLVFTPYGVDNLRFQDEAKIFSPQKETLRTQLDLPADAFVVLFSGKFIAKKRPLDLLKALAKIRNPNVVAVFVGEGELRSEMEDFIQKNNLQHRAFLTGFVNQSAIPRYYAAADVFAMCSGTGETWGLSTNEAMNFSLPVILSDQVGCADDLVEEGKNGFTFRCGDTADLAEKITFLAEMPETQRRDMGAASLQKIAAYSYEVVITGLQKI